MCFISNAGNLGRWRGDSCPKANFPHTGNQWIRAFIGRGRGLHAETALPAQTVIFQLVIVGLTAILTLVLLIVLGTVNLQFQGPFVPISLRPILGIVAAHVLGAVCSSCS